MMNFVLGIMAGGLIACIATIAAARHPEVQSRLGLFPAAPSTLLTVTPRQDPTCPPATVPAPTVGTQEMLFSKRRFWSVAP